jgi:hypothetical protein
MEQASGGTSSRRRGIDAAASANKRAADSLAAALASTIRELVAAGFVSQRTLTDELNRRGIPAAHGGSWHRTSVSRVLRRLDELAGNGVKRLALKRPADVRAEALGPTIHKLRKAGFSVEAIARELNEREITTAHGARWHPTSVRRLLRRLERLEPSSRTAVAPCDAD